MPQIFNGAQYRRYKRMGLGCIALVALAIGSVAWDEHVFNSMSPAQHLSEARNGSRENLQSIQLALRQLGAIPANTPESQAEKDLEVDLLAQERVVGNANAAKREADIARANAVSHFVSDLNNLGYDMVIERSGTPDEIATRSAEFNETDHRVHSYPLFAAGLGQLSRCAGAASSEYD